MINNDTELAMHKLREGLFYCEKLEIKENGLRIVERL